MRRYVLLLALLLLACTDTGVVGEAPPTAGSGCDPRCDDDEHCDPRQASCVECLEDPHCATDDDGPFCNLERHACEQCREAGDCSDAASFCEQGKCRQCVEDDDCPGDAHCDEGECDDDDD